MPRFVLRFFPYRASAFVVALAFVATDVALHLVSIRTLDELS